MSELLRRLDERLASELDAPTRSVLLAQRACYLARVGDFSQSRAIVKELRAGLHQPGYESAAIWVMLVEGVLDFFERLGDDARDRIRRAYLLSLAIKREGLVCICSAWRAHIEFEFSNFEAMSQAIKHVLDRSSHADDESLSRVALTLAYCFTLADDQANAKHWYERARRHAVAAGDQATIEAIIHNRASFGLAASRIRRCLGDLTPEDVRMNRLELTSARNFQTLINVTSLNSLTELCEARLVALERKADLAIPRFLALIDQRPFASNNFNRSMVWLEVAHCRAESGDLSGAERDLKDVIESDFSVMDPDDRMYAAWLVVDLGRMGVGSGDPAALGERLRVAREEFLAFRRGLSEAISPFTATSATVIGSGGDA
jgi:hypothetical protein